MSADLEATPLPAAAEELELDELDELDEFEELPPQAEIRPAAIIAKAARTTRRRTPVGKIEARRGSTEK